LITYFFGSTPGDLEPASKDHPFPPCPDTPNCTIHSVEFTANSLKLFEVVKSAIHKISPYTIETNSQSLQIDAVFRIPVFGFKDDVRIIIKPVDSERSVLHIKSSSRIGKSDLGVNRRRIKRILSVINQQIL
jgi:uncharacterized protein (DUF1499 family)